MKHFLFVFLLLFGANNAFTQGNARATTPSFTNQASQSGLNGLNRTMRTIANMSAQFRYRTIAEEYKDIDGSPFLTENSVKTTLIANDGTVFNGVPLTIDLYVEEIIAIDENGEKLILNGNHYQEIFFENEGQLISLKKVNPKSPDKFYQIIYESDSILLYKDQDAKLRKGENFGISKTKSIFKHQVKYYIKKGNDKAKRVSLKKKVITEHFPKHEARIIDEYINKNQLKSSNEKDMLILFNALNKEKARAKTINRP